jgi:hypothetical protein
MKELVLDLIVSYQNRVSAVEELLTGAYQAMPTSDATFAELDREKERLRTNLRETLVRNCSLRRKDFNNLMEKVFSDSERKRRDIEEEHRQIRQTVKKYLDEQRELASSLKEQLLGFTAEEADRDGFEAIINHFKSEYQDKGQEVFGLLRNFQSHLDLLRQEQDEINHKLQRLLERGESLTIEDLRQLEAAKAREERKAERQLRREDVRRLLLHFKQERTGPKTVHGNDAC